MASYICITGVARNPYAEEALVISTLVVTPTATYADKNASMMARCRLEGGPVRFRFVLPPTSTTGTYLQPGDILELSSPELQQLLDHGGFILDTTAVADATLWIVYYR